MPQYSHSKLSTFEQCPLKFKFKYIDRIVIPGQSIEAFLGGIVHETLEWIYNKTKNKEGTPTVDETVTYYSNKWTEKFKQDEIIIVRKLKIEDYFNRGIKFLLDYYMKHQPFEDGTIEVEKRIILNLDKINNCQIIGFIDRLVYNKVSEEYEVHDYKTGNALPKKGNIDQDRQLGMYSMAIKELFGKDKKVRLIWHYLAFNQEIRSARTNEQLEILKTETIELIEKIESTTSFPAKPSKLCDWCEYKSQCPIWQETQEDDDFEYKKEKQTSLDLDKYPTVAKYIKGQ